MIPLGDPIPLSLQLGDGATDKYVRAHVYKADGTSQVTGSPVALTHVSGGRYIDQSLTMPPGNCVEARYETFDDAGFTTPSGESIVTEKIYLKPDASSGGDSSNGLAEVIVGIVSDDDVVGTVEDCE